MSSSIVVRTSTKGTSATTAPNRSGAALITAPISSPPADPPRMRQPVRGGPAGRRPGARATATKSLKVVGFWASRAHLVPRAAHLAAAAHVGDGEDDPAVEQLRPQRRERRVDRDLVAAVAVEQEGRGPARRELAVGADVDEVAPGDDRDRDAHAVARRRPTAGPSRTRWRRSPRARVCCLRTMDLAGRDVDVGDESRRDERR